MHTYTTRSSTKSGQQTLEPMVDIKTGRVPKTTSFEFGGPIGMIIYSIVSFFIEVLPFGWPLSPICIKC